MAGKRFTAGQIIIKLREAEVGLAQGQTVGQVCKQIGVTEHTYYRWLRHFGRLSREQAAKLTKCEDMERQIGALKARNDDLTGQLNEARGTISRLRRYAKRLKKQQGKANRDLSRWYCVLTTNRELHAQHRTILVFMLRVMLGRFSLPNLTRDLRGKCSSEDAATLHRHANRYVAQSTNSDIRSDFPSVRCSAAFACGDPASI